MSIKSEALAEGSTPTYVTRFDGVRVPATDYQPVWLDSLAGDVTLEGSLMNGVVQGAEAEPLNGKPWCCHRGWLATASHKEEARPICWKPSWRATVASTAGNSLTPFSRHRGPHQTQDLAGDHREGDGTMTGRTAMATTYAELPNKLLSAANGVDYAYREAGDGGVPLVLLQHFRGNLDSWDPALIDALAPGRRVVTFDNTGVGGSSGRTPDTAGQMARDAIAFITALGLGQADILGFSIGSFVAQRRLTHARLAGHHQRPAFPRPDSIHDAVQQAEFAAPTAKPGCASPAGRMCRHLTGTNATHPPVGRGDGTGHRRCALADTSAASRHDDGRHADAPVPRAKELSP